MKVLYIGFAKTGTMTIGSALEILGYKVHSFEEHCTINREYWCEVLKNGGSKDVFRKMFQNVDAAVDIPVFFFWKEILEAFPDCKLIVNYRDDESWLRSWINQIEVITNEKLFQVAGVLSYSGQKYMRHRRLINRVCFGGEDSILPWKSYHGINHRLMLRRYQQHNLEIQMTAPRDNLFVIDYKDGWKKLCKFLNKPIPDVPFPFMNKKGGIIKHVIETHPLYDQFKKEIAATVICLIAISIAFFLLCWKQ